MHQQDLDTEWERHGSARQREMVLEMEAEIVSARDEVDLDIEGPAGSAVGEGFTVDGPASRIAGAGLDDLLDEFVELVTARDLDGLTDVLAPDVLAEFLDSTSCFGAIDGLNELVLRNPTLMFTRGDLDSEPIVALWILDQDKDCYDLVGYLMFEMTDSNELIQRLEFVEELPGLEDLVIETPEGREIPEWDVWSAYDEH